MLYAFNRSNASLLAEISAYYIKFLVRHLPHLLHGSYARVCGHGYWECIKLAIDTLLLWAGQPMNGGGSSYNLRSRVWGYQNDKKSHNFIAIVTADRSQRFTVCRYYNRRYYFWAENFDIRRICTLHNLPAICDRACENRACGLKYTVSFDGTYLNAEM